MNPAASNFGQFPPPNSFVRKIEHSDPTLSIVEDQAAGGAESTTTRKITTDGKPAASNSTDMPRYARRFGWEGHRRDDEYGKRRPEIHGQNVRIARWQNANQQGADLLVAGEAM